MKRYKVYNSTRFDQNFHRVIGFFSKNWIPILIIILFLSFLFYLLMHFIFSFLAICTAIVVFIGLFNPKKIEASLKYILVFTFLLIVVATPILLPIYYESYRINNPKTIVQFDDPWIDELVEEFRQTSEFPEFSDEQLNGLAEFVERKVPYKTNLLQVLYPSISDLKKIEGGDCRGRALVAYGLLKKLEYKKVYIAGSGSDHHVWIRIYENGDYKEIFNYFNSDAVVLFNEEETIWINETQELNKILLSGFKFCTLTENFPFSLLFFIPVGFWLLLFLIFSKERKLKKFITFIIFLGCIFLIALVSLYFSIFLFERINPILLSLISGLTLRIFSIIKTEK